ncbi:hypothetical protein TUMEXPCC7403_17915 [Tumidithrix helvetica PCC 7403]
MSKSEIINVPQICCRCTSKKNLLPWGICLKYLKSHFVIVRVYRTITFDVFICESCSRHIKASQQKINRIIIFSLSIAAIFSILIIICSVLPKIQKGIAIDFQEFMLIVLASLSISCVAAISLFFVLALIVVTLNYDAFFGLARISFFPPIRIIFSNKKYTSLFKTINPNLRF